MKLKLFFLFAFFIFALGFISSVSDEAIHAGGVLDQARQDLNEIIERGINYSRANESYEEAAQLYSAQLALESLGRNAKYDLVIEYSNEVNKIKGLAFLAQDELEVFLNFYNEVDLTYDLKEMSREYNSVLSSFQDERFEETPKLIDIAYEKLSEIQASQTAVNLFYNTTSRSIKNFFKNNWVEVFFGVLFSILFWLFIQDTVRRFRIRIRVNRLLLRRKILKDLIKKAQRDYFDGKTISSSEYKNKLRVFKNMILNANRELPLLKEKNAKLGGKKLPNFVKRAHILIFQRIRVFVQKFKLKKITQ